MIEQMTQSWTCWAILILALYCYQQLFLHVLSCRQLKKTAQQERKISFDEQTEKGAEIEHEFSGVLIGALPLLGLFGTIVGLLECFRGIASEGASSELISSGIANALLTTQLGLVCAVPAWLLLAAVRSKSALGGVKNA